ncbi:hypothetical protein ACCS54_06475 [Rhizobium johnstonii]|uniref:hypothetical protein n=1 Tax=Rhizobium TaxID=379 RepID=UPI0013E00CA8|nr:hypothetical protein [Rhizobium leguminosarum]QIO63517.1 hypothetical protein HA462_20835 [Rhizobium leguminosarum bv. trifolii]
MIEITKNIRAHFSMTSSFAVAWERRGNRENVPDRWNGMALMFGFILSVLLMDVASNFVPCLPPDQP